ncbi:hypothetical protein J7K05_00045 [bacterium]|nr:hypothetical protein [bacterium]
MDSKLLQQLIKSIQAKVRCPVCSMHYPEEAIKFRGNINNFFLFQLTCPHCQSNVFASVMVNERGIPPKADIFLETTPSIKPPLFEQRKKPIKADEVIEFARFIEKQNTPLSDWLK